MYVSATLEFADGF